MRHRAPRNLLALLRQRARRPRRPVFGPLFTRRSLRLAGAVALALAVATGGLVAASELEDDAVPHSDAPAVTEPARPAPEPSRSNGRTSPPPTTPADSGPSAPPDEDGSASRPGAGPAPARTETRNHRRTREEDLLVSPLGASASKVPTTRSPSPDATRRSVTPRPSRDRPSASEQPSRRESTREPTRESTRESNRPTAQPTRTQRADRNPPETTIVSGPTLADAVGLGQDSRFVFDADESGTFACSLDGRPFRPCTSPQEYDGLAPGRHEFAVRAIDDAGNVDPTPDRQAWLTTGLDRVTRKATDKVTRPGL